MQRTQTHTQIRGDYVVAEVREIVVTFKWSLVETEPSCGTELALMYSSIVAVAFETIRMYQKCTHSSSSLCDWPRKHTVNPVDMDYFPQSNNRSSKSKLNARFLQCVWKKAAKKTFKRRFQVKKWTLQDIISWSWPTSQVFDWPFSLHVVHIDWTLTILL